VVNGNDVSNFVKIKCLGNTQGVFCFFRKLQNTKCFKVWFAFLYSRDIRMKKCMQCAMHTTRAIGAGNAAASPSFFFC